MVTLTLEEKDINLILKSLDSHIERCEMLNEKKSHLKSMFEETPISEIPGFQNIFDKHFENGNNIEELKEDVSILKGQILKDRKKAIEDALLKEAEGIMQNN